MDRYFASPAHPVLNSRFSIELNQKSTINNQQSKVDNLQSHESTPSLMAFMVISRTGAIVIPVPAVIPE
jgi:hypothetical protein